MSARSRNLTGSVQREARRRWLAQAGALFSTTAFPFQIPFALAQSQSTLNALPRFALVIGNTKYLDAPLKNPGNDAKAIAGELQKLGFQINLKLDAGRNEMLDAIRTYGSELARRKSMGLFYYAGHGAQLAWRNYLIPVDAEIEKLEDMQTRAVDLTTLLEGLIKAQNPMNVIILDACRDNPFGNKAQIAQKGLSQFDAPPGSLLAYATAPGNVAADGEGANGLYTENLLRELRSPEAKIEDVFKRVRLNVRLKSGGRQIPWESTSLEDDFYFLPPQQVKKLSEAELKRQFDEELAIWEKIEKTNDPVPVEEYIRRYPSGKFSELAQFRLDKLLAEREAALAEAERQKQFKLAADRKLIEDKRLAEEKRLEDEKRLALEKRLAEERQAAEEKRLADEKMLAKLTEEKRAAEAGRLAAERKLAEERRVAEEKKLAEERRLAEEKRRADESALARAVAAAAQPVQLVSVAPNPFSKGTARANGNFTLGDSYSFRVLDLYTRLETGAYTDVITAITPTEVVFSDGARVADFLGNSFKDREGRRSSGSQTFIAEYSLGKKWTTRFRSTAPGGKGDLSDIELDFKVAARESITVPAGTFDAYKVEGQGWVLQFGINLQVTYWIAPELCRRPIASEFRRRHQSGKVLSADRTELTAFKQAG